VKAVLLALALVALAAPAHARPPVRVRDALCVSQSDAPFLALAPTARAAYLGALARAGWRLMRIDFTWSRIEPEPPHDPPLNFSISRRTPRSATRRRSRSERGT
jgi:hypothetical protein